MDGSVEREEDKLSVQHCACPQGTGTPHPICPEGTGTPHPEGTGTPHPACPEGTGTPHPACPEGTGTPHPPVPTHRGHRGTGRGRSAGGGRWAPSAAPSTPSPPPPAKGETHFGTARGPPHRHFWGTPKNVVVHAPSLPMPALLEAPQGLTSRKLMFTWRSMSTSSMVPYSL